MMMIYISGPIRGDGDVAVEANVLRAVDAALIVYRKGHVPVCPHLHYYMHLRDRVRTEDQDDRMLQWEDYMVIDHALVGACDGLLFLGSSPGADLELKLAIRLGKSIFLDLESVPTIPRPSFNRDGITWLFTGRPV